MTDAGAPAALAHAREAFDLPDDVAYLDCAALGPVPVTGVEAGLMGLARKARPWTIAAEDRTVPVDQLRAAFAGLVGVPDDLDGIAITPSASYGLSVAAANLPLAAGRAVVVLEGQFPSDVYPWEHLAGRSGGTLHRVARPADEDWTAAVLADLERLGGRVGVVSVPPCHWIDGGRVDLAAVGAAARAVGAAVVVDAAQVLGAEPFDATVVQPDFVVGVTYKWLCGPYSLGFVWAAPHRRDGEPIEHGWPGRANSHDLSLLTEYTAEHQPGARRYDMGEVAYDTLVPVALVGAHLVAGWGPAAVARHARVLTDRLVAGTAPLGFTAAPRDLRCAHIVGLRPPEGVAPAVLVPLLADRGVHVSARGPALRVSAHAFTTTDDIDRLIACLGELVSPPGGGGAPRLAP